MENISRNCLNELLQKYQNIPANGKRFECLCGKLLAEIFIFGTERKDKFYLVYEPHIKIICGVYVKCRECNSLKSTEETYSFCPKCYPKIHERLIQIIYSINSERKPQYNLGYFTTIKEFSSSNDTSQQIKLVHQGTEGEFKKILSCIRINKN